MKFKNKLIKRVQYFFNIYNKKVYCEICKKSFVNPNVLLKHVNAIHKNISPFKCQYPNCEKSFRTGYRLYIHELIHKGIRPHKCNICKKTFVEKGTLKVHLNSHSPFLKYKCNLCNFCCKSDSHLREHYKYKHRKEK
jgi:KRAB domain-containing zinc finger protein